MPQAIVDPEELRQFAASLKRFNTEVEERIATLSGQLLSLAKTWRDQEHKRFVEEFEQHMRSMARFTEVTREYIPYLVRKAEAIDQYLQQR
jgi:WXG100 family type VII secretion target